jgi:hypothetical protein
MPPMMRPLVAYFPQSSHFMAILLGRLVHYFYAIRSVPCCLGAVYVIHITSVRLAPYYPII